MYTDRNQDLLAGRPLGKRFRAERKRLSLSSVAVAHICGTTESTVFNWEAGRARIPLSAAEKLWMHGFDPDRLVSGSVQTVVVRSINGAGLKVPEHLLKRYSLDPSRAVVFHNRSRFDNLLPLGVLCLLAAWVDWEDVRETPAIALFRHLATKKLFLCHVSGRQKKSARLWLGKLGATIQVDRLLGVCQPEGTYCCGIGNRPVEQAGETHEAVLGSVLHKIR